MKKMTETALQCACFLWFSNNYSLKSHNPRYLMMVIPNETASSLAGILKGLGVPQSILTKATSLVMQTLKLMGFCAGASDTMIIAPNKVHFIEFKLPENNQQPNQKEFEERVIKLGHEYTVIKSLEAFKTHVITKVVS